jgi:predicted transglutaminase-like cysteine proteinase
MAHARKLLFATAAVPALLVSAPAQSQSSDAWMADSAKTEAIIGAPSALAAILAQQHAPTRAIALRPAGYAFQSPYRVQDAVIRTGDLPQQGRRIVSPAVLSGKPDIFGTVALQVRHTPLDSKWKRVEGARVNGAAAAYSASLHSLGEHARLQAINAYVNRHVRFVDDERQYGQADVWSTANSTLNRARGDCEDYAIAKIQMLRAAGFSYNNLYLVVLRDLVRRTDHAVAVVRSDDHMYVLDNGTDELLDSETVTDYRPVLTFSAYGAWIHGYRVAKPVNVATAVTSPLAPVLSAAGAENQRSRSASLLAFNTGFSR